MQLSVTLIAVISQQLLPHASGKGRLASYEIMIMTPAIANLIREHKTNRIYSSIQTGQRLGMVTMDQCLIRLYNDGRITGDTAIHRSHNPEEVRQKIMGGL